MRPHRIDMITVVIAVVILAATLNITASLLHGDRPHIGPTPHPPTTVSAR